MSYKKNYTSLIVSAVFCIISFFGGFFLAKSFPTPSATQEMADSDTNQIEYIYEPAISENEIPEDTYYYLLSADNNVLKLYEIYNDTKTLLKSVSINFSTLPKEDQTKLSKGITLDNIEKCYTLIEDFSS